MTEGGSRVDKRRDREDPEEEGRVKTEEGEREYTGIGIRWGGGGEK